ncbi:MAG: Hsp20/alpha crystallin family protein [Anaerolineae bacterium]
MANEMKQRGNMGSEATQRSQETGWLSQPAMSSPVQAGGHIFPSIIISATDERLLVRAEVPGMHLEDFDIRVSGDTLTVEGVRITGQELEGGWYHRRERESGGFNRAIRLPAGVDGDRAEATYQAGVLTISLPLKEAAKPKEIPIQVIER